MPIANRSKGAIPVRVKVLIPEDLVGIHLKPEMGAIVAFYKKSDSEPAQASTPRGAANANAATEPESPGEVATNAEPASEQPGEPPPESENR
jgi:hypothetical protein